MFWIKTWSFNWYYLNISDISNVNCNINKFFKLSKDFVDTLYIVDHLNYFLNTVSEILFWNFDAGKNFDP